MNKNIDAAHTQHSHYVHALQAAVPQPRETDGRFGAKLHAEMEQFTAPAAGANELAALPRVADPSNHDDARLYASAHPIVWELEMGDMTGEYLPVRRRPDGNIEVDIDNGESPEGFWVASSGNVDPFVIADSDSDVFDVAAARAFFAELPAADVSNHHPVMRRAWQLDPTLSAEVVAAKREYAAAAEKFAGVAQKLVGERIRRYAPAAAAVTVTCDDEGDVTVDKVSNSGGDVLYDSSWATADGNDDAASLALAEQVEHLSNETTFVQDSAPGLRPGMQVTFTLPDVG